MQHINFSDTSLLVGDEATGLLLEYAAALGANDMADTVTLRAISSSGDDIVATFLLNAGSALIAESATTTAPEPDNALAIDYMRDRLRLISRPPQIVGDDPDGEIDFDNPAGNN